MRKVKTILASGALLGSAAAYAAKCDLSTVKGRYAETVAGWVGAGDDRQPLSGIRVRKFEIVDGFGKVTRLFSGGVTDGVPVVASDAPTLYGSYKVSAISKGSCSVEIKRSSPTLLTAVGVNSDNGNHISAVGSSDGTTTSTEYVRVAN